MTQKSKLDQAREKYKNMLKKKPSEEQKKIIEESTFEYDKNQPKERPTDQVARPKEINP
ncbi:MAG: hypothetical protein H6626_13110 [Pseudobdellovibrionaceae bacterium]|nr:hypothetical protein [Bdellovibrionales bacterium]USN47112.1 MAG: hypothetical protein H6626_13110 [Pseudobdellovibrionaceae bacterium]